MRSAGTGAGSLSRPRTARCPGPGTLWNPPPPAQVLPCASSSPPCPRAQRTRRYPWQHADANASGRWGAGGGGRARPVWGLKSSELRVSGPQLLRFLQTSAGPVGCLACARARGHRAGPSEGRRRRPRRQAEGAGGQQRAAAAGMALSAARGEAGAPGRSEAAAGGMGGHCLSRACCFPCGDTAGGA